MSTYIAAHSCFKCPLDAYCDPVEELLARLELLLGDIGE